MACSYLDVEFVRQAFGYDESLLGQGPEEEPAGQGWACFYADVILQVDPFSREFIERTIEGDVQTWEQVPDIDDRAFFRDRRGEYAEVLAWVGERTFTLQVGVPATRTAEALKPEVLRLARATAARLK